MTPVTPSSVCDSEREAFEAWALSAGFSRESLHPSILPGQYAWSSIDNRWHAWKARAALAERTQQEALTDEQFYELADSADCNPDSTGWGSAFSFLAFGKAVERLVLGRPTSAANSTAQPSEPAMPERLTLEEFERDDHGYSGDCS